MIFKFPEIILEIIQGFLTPRSVYHAVHMTHTIQSEQRLLLEDNFKRNMEEDNAWRNLVNSTKSVIELKRKTIYIVLKDSFASLYMNDETFRQRVDGLVRNRQDQLRISFRKSNNEPFRFRNASWDGCNKLTLANFSFPIDLSTFPGVQHLSLYTCFYHISISSIISVQTLELYNCDAIEVISNCPKLVRLRVDSCYRLRDISNLTNLRTLSVRDCPSLTIQEKTVQPVQYLWLDETLDYYL